MLSQTKDEVKDAALDNLRTALVGTLPRGSAGCRGVCHRGCHQLSRLLASQDTVCPHHPLVLRGIND